MIMDKRKRDLLIAGVLVLIFVASLLKNVILPAKPKVSAPAEAPPPAATTDLAFLAGARNNKALFEKQRAVWSAEWSRDPFLLPAAGEEGSSRLADLKLSGIVWDEREPFAMVNEKVVKVGDMLGGYTVIEIKQSSVVLWSADGTFEELRLFQGQDAKA